jgi:hypothetical protein
MYEEFWRRVTKDGKKPCALRMAPCIRCDGAGQMSKLGRTGLCLLCRGAGVMKCHRKIDAHHFVPKRRLHTEAAKTDVRNGVPLCRGHHEMVEQGLMLAPKPAELVFFLVDHDVPASSVPAGREEAVAA